MALLLRLARRDAARGALRSAEQLLATAAAAAAGTAVAATITAERVTLLTLVGRTADALALGVAHLDAVRGDDHAELCLQLARTAVTAGAWADVETYVGRAGRPGDPRSLVLRADAAFGAGRVADASELAAAAIARAEQVADEHGSDAAAAALCEALGVAGRLAWRTDLDLTEALARRAAQVAGEHGLLPWRVTALFQLGMMRMLRAGDMAPMLQSRELALDAGMLGHVAAVDYVHSDYLWLIDGPGAALPTARAADDLVRVLRPPGHAFSPRAMVEVLDALAGLASGRATAERTRSRSAAVAAEQGGGPRLEFMLLALTALVEHDLPRAAAELSTAVPGLRHGSLRHAAAALPRGPRPGRRRAGRPVRAPRRAHPGRDPGARQPRRLRLGRRHRARPRRAPRRGGGAARRGRDRARRPALVVPVAAHRRAGVRRRRRVG